MAHNESNQVYIYVAKMTDEYHSFLSLLHDIDSQKYLGFKNEKRKKAFVCGRALLSFAVSKHLNKNSYRVIYNCFGKPELSDCGNWSFNLTHSGDYILLIMSERNCGIDCELVKPRNIKKLSFVFSENDQMKLAESNYALDCFYQLWTKKEATVKYLGGSVFSPVINTDKLVIKTYQYEKIWFSICLAKANLSYQFYYHKF